MVKQSSKRSKESHSSQDAGISRHQKVGVFVDAQNMYHSAKNLYKARVNFGEVLKRAINNRQLIRAFAYVIKTESGEEEAFLEALKKAGFELKIKDLQIFPGGMKKGDWDVGLAMDAVILADKIDVAIIVAGDGDLIPLVEYLKINRGVKVEMMAFSRSASARLVAIADDFTDMGEDQRRYLLQK